MNDRNIFEKKIKPLLTYIGTIGAALMSIAYIITVCVLIKGFKAEGLLNITIFAIVNAAVGFMIMQFLKIQGESFARNLPENKKVLDDYYNSRTKDKKFRSMKYYWVTSVVKDTLIKCLTLGASTVGVIYIVIEGSNDYNLLFMAFVNLIMFICFGLLSMSKTYDFFNNNHIPYLREQLTHVKEEDKLLAEQAVKVEEPQQGVLKNDSLREQQGISQSSGTSREE